jgi:hypothetical protein
VIAVHTDCGSPWVGVVAVGDDFLDFSGGEGVALGGVDVGSVAARERWARQQACD